jgi:hypothetical protein
MTWLKEVSKSHGECAMKSPMPSKFSTRWREFCRPTNSKVVLSSGSKLIQINNILLLV